MTYHHNEKIITQNYIDGSITKQYKPGYSVIIKHFLKEKQFKIVNIVSTKINT